MSQLDQLLTEAESYLWSRDFKGYKNEMTNIEVFKDKGLYKYVKHRNPKNPKLWKKKKGLGVDMVIKCNDTHNYEYVFYIEESYCNSEYYYREAWFRKCRLPRFRNYPDSDRFHYKIILTNKPQNFKGVEHLAIENQITILNLNQLLTIIYEIINKTDFRLFFVGSGITTLSPKVPLTNWINPNNNKLTTNNVYAPKQDKTDNHKTTIIISERDLENEVREFDYG